MDFDTYITSIKNKRKEIWNKTKKIPVQITLALALVACSGIATNAIAQSENEIPYLFENIQTEQVVQTQQTQQTPLLQQDVQTEIVAFDASQSKNNTNMPLSEQDYSTGEKTNISDGLLLKTNGKKITMEDLKDKSKWPMIENEDGSIYSVFKFEKIENGMAVFDSPLGVFTADVGAIRIQGSQQKDMEKALHDFQNNHGGVLILSHNFVQGSNTIVYGIDSIEGDMLLLRDASKDTGTKSKTKVENYIEVMKNEVVMGTSIAATMSKCAQAITDKYIQFGVAYVFGAKEVDMGRADCSGWVAALLEKSMEHMNSAAGDTLYAENNKRLLEGGAAGIISNISQKTGKIYSNTELQNIGGGYAIGIDTGAKSWDKGRFKGIDHIVFTYENEEGQTMISESTSSKGGLTITPYNLWFAKMQQRGAKMYGVDVATGLANQDIAQKIDTGIVASNTTKKTMRM